MPALRIERRGALAEIYMVSALICWAAAAALMDPQFGGTDVFIFKEAGVNLAMGRGFVAPFVPGNWTFEPAFYASYPPLFPLLFGVYTTIFGIGAYQNTYFTLLISFAACFLFMRLAARAFADHSPRILWSVVVMLLGLGIPAGLMATSPDRPEPLSFALFVSTILMAGSRLRRETAAAAGCLVAGVNVLVSPFGGILNLLALLLIHRRLFRTSGPGLAALCGSLFAAVPLAAAGLCAVADPEALARFLRHAATEKTGAGRVLTSLLAGDLSVYSTELRDTLFSSVAHSVALLVSWAALVAFLGLATLLRYRRNGNRRTLAPGLALLGLLLLPALFFPAQRNYMGFARSAVMALLIYLLGSEPDAAPAGSRAVAGMFVILMLLQVPFVLRDVTIRTQNRGSHENAMREVRGLRQSGHGSSTLVAVSPSLYFLLRPHFEAIDVDRLERREDIRRVRLVAVGYAGSGDPARPSAPPWLSSGGFRLISEPEVPRLTRLFGRVISRSSNIWEPALYENPAFQEGPSPRPPREDGAPAGR